MKTLGILCWLLLCLFVVDAPAADLVGVYEHWVPAGSSRTIEWSAVPGASGYEIYVRSIEDSKTFLVGKEIPTNFHTIVWKTRNRHLVYYARPYFDEGGARRYGEWGNSLSPSVGVVDGQPQPWVVYVP